MKYSVANTLTDILDAWCVVYKQYLAASLIKPNEFSIFTHPEYLGNNTAVIIGSKMNHTQSTLSAILDSKKGLSLDKTFSSELATLRKQGKRLTEIGLFADSTKENSSTRLLDLVCNISLFGHKNNHNDFVMEVSPEQANFFNQSFGFNLLSKKQNTSFLNQPTVVLMHFSYEDLFKKNNDFFETDDLNFDDRYRFNPHNFISVSEFSNSVEKFLKRIWSPISTESYPKSKLDPSQLNKTSFTVQGIISPISKTTEGQLIKAVTIPWQLIAGNLSKNWDLAFQIPASKWEELIAAAFDKAGYDEVTLTPRSGDHGRDVIASKKGVGSIRIIGSVKAYKPDNIVRYDDVRALLGVLNGDQQASKAIFTTTSDFPPNILKDPFIKPFVPYRLELMNGIELKRWFTDLLNKSNNC